MPLYEYQCQSCNSEFEKMVRFSEAMKDQECPFCHSLETSRKISKIASSTSGNSPSSSSSCRSTGPFR